MSAKVIISHGQLVITNTSGSEVTVDVPTADALQLSFEQDGKRVVTMIGGDDLKLLKLYCAMKGLIKL